MYYGIVKKIPVEIDGEIEFFPQFFSYETLEELLKENNKITEYYECNENHLCVLVSFNNVCVPYESA